MALSLSEEFRDMAVELVDLFGKEYVIRRRTPINPDPERPTYVEMKEVDYLCKAAFVAWTEEQIKFLQVLREDLQVIVAWTENLPNTIAPGDLFVDGTRVYTIIPPESVFSVNGIPIAWQLLVRR